MTAVDPTRPAVVEQRAVLLSLASIQARRYAQHPLFLVGVAVLLAATPSVHEQGYFLLETGVAVAFFIGVLGIVVAYRLTASEDRAIALLPSAPVSAATRSLALCAACLVPFAVGLLWFAFQLASFAIWPPKPDLVDVVGGWDAMVVITFGSSAMCALGGPLLGVAAGRWLRFPGAGVLVAVALTISAVFFVSGALTPTLVHNPVIQASSTLMPFTEWVLVDDNAGVTTLRGVRDGAPLGHVLYQVGLCGLVVCAAVLKDAVGSNRARWIRVAGAFGAVSVLAYAWALLG